MKIMPIIIVMVPLACQAQSFDFAGKEAAQAPELINSQIRAYIKTHDGISLEAPGTSHPYVPVFNVLKRSQKKFTDGLYYFSWGAHDPGRLFIYSNKKISFLNNGHISDVLRDYTCYLSSNKLPEATQVVYLSAIAAFMKFRYQQEQRLIKDENLLEAE